MNNKYRYDSSTGELFEYDSIAGCYIFVTDNPDGLSKAQLIREYEDQPLITEWAEWEE